MSTRCMIKICKKHFASEFVYHHCDGYPDGVGSELVKILRYYKTVEWTPNKISNALQDYDSQYEDDGDVNAHGDEDYLYVIDCDERTIKCYEVAYDASFDDLGDEVEIPDNTFTCKSKDKQLWLLIDSIDHAYLQTDGTYGDLALEVVDKVKYLKDQIYSKQHYE